MSEQVEELKPMTVEEANLAIRRAERTRVLFDLLVEAIEIDEEGMTKGLFFEGVKKVFEDEARAREAIMPLVKSAFMGNGGGKKGKR